MAGPILEPACGSGRTLLPLLAAGHDVTGFDPSVEMLERCRDRCAAAGHALALSQQRFENFVCETRFAAIVVPVGSLTPIADFAVAMAVLTRFHVHLAPGGLLILDVPSIGELAPSTTDRRRWTTADGDVLTCEGVRSVTDWLTQCGERLYRYGRWRAQCLVETRLEPMVQRFLEIEELRQALIASGFEVTAIIGT